MKVLKFGGTSVGTPQSIKQVIKIIQRRKQKGNSIAVIVSAFSKVTDSLVQTARVAAAGEIKYKTLLNDLEKRHYEAVKCLIRTERQSGVMARVKIKLNELENILKGIFLVKEVSNRVMDLVMSFGERLSAYIISEAIKEKGISCEFLDSRKLIVTDNSFGNARVDFEKTSMNIRNYFRLHKNLQIITGFIASSQDGLTTTLGRQGSDYSASIFAVSLNASLIEIWTDVSGIMTADPRRVKKAFPIPNITFEEAMEMSYFGAKVIYPPTIQPASRKGIPIHIKNTFDPDAPGTVIDRKPSSDNYLIKGISSIDDIAVIRLQGTGMVGVSGTAKRLFGALSEKNINVILITQASSEHSICVAINAKNAEEAKRLIEDEFTMEISMNRIDHVILEYGFAIIAVVGEKMRHRQGIAGKLFQVLGKNGINIIAIAQGSSELNISAVINKKDETKSLNVIHDAFFLSSTKSLNVFVLGTGLIGNALLKQIDEHKDYMIKEQGVEIKIIAVANSKKIYYNYDGISITDWPKLLNNSQERSNIEKMVEIIKKSELPNCVFVDCTSNEEVTTVYKNILESNISIVTPNKKANSGKYSFYKKLRDIAISHNVKFLYETNVGAGLPVINTLKDLLTTGDKIIRIEAILSGTLSYIFNSFIPGKSFSSVVREAMEKGLTEPDPREDLKGIDVARKLLILARETGLNLELRDIKIGNLMPPRCRKSESIKEFIIKLKESDEYFRNLLNSALKNNRILKYIATLENGKADVSLKEIDNSHPFYYISGNDNVISFTTERYKSTPLVIKGPGAGAEVTAAGVLADILRISDYLM